MQRVMRLIALTLLVFIAGFFSARQVRVRSQELGRKPFTAMVVERQYDGSGRQIVLEEIVSAVRSDGSQVRMFHRQLPDGSWFQPKWVLLVPAGVRISVDPATESIVTYHLPSRPAAPSSTCGVSPDAPRSSWLGYAVVVDDVRVKPPEMLSDKHWLAPNLGCFPLRDEISYAPGPAGAATKMVREAVFVIPGDPSPSLFEIPASYRERSPSELAAEFARRFPGHQAWRSGSSSVLDQAYQSSGAQR